MASQFPGLSNTSHNFASSLNLLRLHSVLLSTQLNYDAQNAQLHTDIIHVVFSPRCLSLELMKRGNIC